MAIHAAVNIALFPNSLWALAALSEGLFGRRGFHEVVRRRVPKNRRAARLGEENQRHGAGRGEEAESPWKTEDPTGHLVLEREGAREGGREQK
jgi:hypothetical protein